MLESGQNGGNMSNSTHIDISLTHDEALVLFDFLARFNENPDEKIFEHPSEQQVLNTVEALLEKILVEPFEPNYSKIIEDARQRLKAQA